MPGAPNRPPSNAPAAPSAVPIDEAARRVVRRLAASRVVLHLDIWKGAVPPDLGNLLDRAEQHYSTGDIAGAELALDQLSVRLAEPRWPTIPEPFRQLRVIIVKPQPPQWDPEHGIDAAEKERRRLRREAERQVALLDGAITWSTGKGIAVDDVVPHVAAAKAALAAPDSEPAFWVEVDTAWSAIRDRVPIPAHVGRPASPPEA